MKKFTFLQIYFIFSLKSYFSFQKNNNSSHITQLIFTLAPQPKNLKYTVSQNFLGMLRWLLKHSEQNAYTHVILYHGIQVNSSGYVYLCTRLNTERNREHNYSSTKRNNTSTLWKFNYLVQMTPKEWQRRLSGKKQVPVVNRVSMGDAFPGGPN